MRPVKGYDPNLDLCLSSTCLLEYPRSKFELVICVASADDTAIPVINHVIEKYPDVRAVLKIGEEDVGPNPKIRNLSQAYREAAGDIIWILDCNVWVAPGTLLRSVDMLEGSQGRPGYKLVHHLPLAVDVTNTRTYTRDNSLPTSSAEGSSNPLLRKDNHIVGSGWLAGVLACGGGRLEECFLSSSHAKFYAAINALAIAPCVVGKSSMHRRSHLLEATQGGERTGLTYFSEYICEDQLLGEKLWMTELEEEKSGLRKWGKHHLGEDLVFQPLEDMSVSDYLARRTRWIRVRKYCTLSATFAEAFTESVVCSLVGSFAVTTVPFTRNLVGSSWPVFLIFWVASMAVWALADRLLFNFFHSYKSTAADEDSPQFLIDRKGRGFWEWLLEWMGREGFAFWVWAAALWPGPVKWRGRCYKIRWNDMKVVEIGNKGVEVDANKRLD